MSVDFQVLARGGVKRTRVFKRVQKIAEELQQYLDRPEVQEDLQESNVPHVPGTVIESIVSPWAQLLGFQSQKRGLFGDCKVDGLRPDFYCPIGSGGILMEVERGKTIINNMDLLDLWKCHICRHAEYLFLVVPKNMPHTPKAFERVHRRLSEFFDPGRRKNYVNVAAVFLFGY